MKLDDVHLTRFPEADRTAKDAIWQVLCGHPFGACGPPLHPERNPRRRD